METFALPLREIQERFTWSDVVLLGWRSAEQTYHMKRKMPKGKGPTDGNAWSNPETGKVRRNYEAGEIPENMPDRFFNKEGELDLSGVTGADAVKYLNMVGFKVPMMGGVGRTKAES